jgi:hypothetical protein
MASNWLRKTRQDNSMIDLSEINCEDGKWTELTTIMLINRLSVMLKCRVFYHTVNRLVDSTI